MLWSNSNVAGQLMILRPYPLKSDPAIVAVNPTNKAEQSAAELVEQGAGTNPSAFTEGVLAASRFTAGAFGFFDLIQSGERPELKGESLPRARACRS